MTLELGQFARAWAGLGAGPGAADPHAALLAAWSEPHRAYHTLDHLKACLAGLEGVTFADPDAVAIALWYHDAVYDTTRADNEAASAALARAHLSAAGAPEAAIARVEALIDATRHAAEPGPDDRDARLLVDIDLGVLGAGPERYARYEAEIRREYAWVPAAWFRARRAELLRGFLARPRVYTTPEFAAREAPARANLAWAIARLEAPEADEGAV